MSDADRFAPWEIASWTLTFMVVLLVIAACWQRVDENNQNSYVIVPQQQHVVCQGARIPICNTGR